MVRAFSAMPSLRLLVVGDGPEMPRLRALAGANVTFTGYLPRPALIATIQKARAFVYAAYEDFGIVLAEAQAAGTPVVAFGRGGAADIVAPLQAEKPTGVLFAEQSVDAVKRAVELFCREERRISPLGLPCQRRTPCASKFPQTLACFDRRRDAAGIFPMGGRAAPARQRRHCCERPAEHDELPLMIVARRAPTLASSQDDSVASPNAGRPEANRSPRPDRAGAAGPVSARGSTRNDATAMC